MPRSKKYVSDVANTVRSVVDSPPLSVIDFKKIVPNGRFGESKKLNFEKWLNRGIDDWVWAVVAALVANLKSGRLEIQSVHTRGIQVGQFLNFLTEDRSTPLTRSPRELQPVHISMFVGWLKDRQKRTGHSANTVRGDYQGTKAVLTNVLDEIGIRANHLNFFPRRVLPNMNFRDTGAAPPYSEKEQARMAAALRSELSDHHHGRIALSSSEVVSLYFLIVAMRTGGNLTPLIEMSRTALKPGLLPGVMVLAMHKHRGKRVVERAVGGPLKGGGKVETPLLMQMDVVAVINRALESSEALVPEAPHNIRDRVWLYRSSSPLDRGMVRCLTDDQLRYNWPRMVKRRSLETDEGSPLIITVQRLRKSFAKRAWKLSEGDPVAVASLLGNSPQVADRHYLSIDDHIKADAANFLNTEFAVQLRDGQPPVARSKNSTVSSEALPMLTPAGRCEDTIHGHLAPKDGIRHCDLFVHCISCPSFAVVGEVDDLWRLFSFKRYAETELATWPAANDGRSTIRSLYRDAIESIEPFALRSFGARLVRAGKAKTEEGVHPFWKALMKQSALRRGAQMGEQ